MVKILWLRWWELLSNLKRALRKSQAWKKNEELKKAFQGRKEQPSIQLTLLDKQYDFVNTTKSYCFAFSLTCRLIRSIYAFNVSHVNDIKPERAKVFLINLMHSLSGRHEGYRRIRRIEDMLADAPWTTWHKKSCRTQDILPAGMNVLLANAECRNPPTAPASTFKSILSSLA